MVRDKFDIKSVPDYKESVKRSKVSLIIKNFKLDKKYQGIGKGLTFCVRTYGCQSNFKDTEHINGILSKLGYKYEPEILKADLIILNTCAIRENAEKKVFGEIGFLSKLKKTNPNILFGICGCMSQEEHVIEKIMNTNNNINFIIGVHNIDELPEVIYDVIKNKKKVIKVLSRSKSIVESIPSVINSKIKSFVNIMQGCDNFCTYCIVPYVRGQMHSRNKDDILKEVNNLIKQGYKEVTLLGQNVNSYGIDLQNKSYRFWDLLEDVAKTNIPRVRFVTSNPWNFDLKIVDVMKKYSNIMPYIHLPVQSGDEQILKRMNRKIAIKEYIKKINYIRKNIPNVAISTDIIVGFPNESDKAFNNTLKLYKKVKFDNAYTFIYSPRSGTPAARIQDKISLEIKQKRLKKLNELVKKYSKENNEKYIGKTLKVLVEGYSKTNNKNFTGYSPNWKVVNFLGKSKIGNIVNVKITSASRFSLNGELVI